MRAEILMIFAGISQKCSGNDKRSRDFEKMSEKLTLTSIPMRLQIFRGISQSNYAIQNNFLKKHLYFGAYVSFFSLIIRKM